MFIASVGFCRGSRVQVILKKVNILSYPGSFLALRLLYKRLKAFFSFIFAFNPMEKRSRVMRLGYDVTFLGTAIASMPRHKGLRN